MSLQSEMKSYEKLLQFLPFFVKLQSITCINGTLTHGLGSGFKGNFPSGHYKITLKAFDEIDDNIAEVVLSSVNVK